MYIAVYKYLFTWGTKIAAQSQQKYCCQSRPKKLLPNLNNILLRKLPRENCCRISLKYCCQSRQALVAIYPIFIAVGLRQDCNKILLHFHYILVAVGLRWDCKKKDYISITFSLRFYYIYITSLQSKCNKNVM